MKCEEVREYFLEMVPAGTGVKSPEAAAHLAGCGACGEALKSFESTMALLDEWRAPEPSPYFQTRFRAQLAELKAQEASAPAWQGFASWLRKPAFGMPVWRPMAAGVLALAMAMGIGLRQNEKSQQSTSAQAQLQKGTAVSDLQTLERNQDMFSDFDVLDDLPSVNGAESQNASEQL
jgi:hypothetical protein